MVLFSLNNFKGTF